VRPCLRATLLRTVGFFLFASAYWALLPLIAHDRISGGSQLYGVLLGSIGAGALGGALGLEWLRSKLGPDRLVALGELGAALALVLFGAAREPITAIAASLIAGACWIVVLSSLNVSAQFSLPEWVRGRGLAVYVTVFFGAMTLGSACWGEIARVGGLGLRTFPRSGRRAFRDPPDMAMQAAERCRHRSRAVHALAGPNRKRRGGSGCGSGSSDDRIPRKPWEARDVPDGGGQARSRTPARRRICMGHFRGCGTVRTIYRDVYR